jgi:hypothetical protein
MEKEIHYSVHLFYRLNEQNNGGISSRGAIGSNPNLIFLGERLAIRH